MVVEHDDVDAKPARDRDRLMARGSAIHRHEQRRPARGEIADRLGVWAVALDDPVGDMQQRLRRAGGAPKFDEQRRGACAVDVIVAKDRDLLAGLDRAREAFDRGVHVP